MQFVSFQCPKMARGGSRFPDPFIVGNFWTEKPAAFHFFLRIIDFDTFLKSSGSCLDSGHLVWSILGWINKLWRRRVSHLAGLQHIDLFFIHCVLVLLQETLTLVLYLLNNKNTSCCRFCFNVIHTEKQQIDNKTVLLMMMKPWLSLWPVYQSLLKS